MGTTQEKLAAKQEKAIAEIKRLKGYDHHKVLSENTKGFKAVFGYESTNHSVLIEHVYSPKRSTIKKSEGISFEAFMEKVMPKSE